MELAPSFGRIAYLGYLLWLAAGLADFACHRRAHLPATSGRRESNFHLGQIALLGTGLLLWLALTPGWMLFALCAVLAAAHAVAGVLDTRSAYGLRAITPLEQHLHSVLDFAPWIALALLGWIVAAQDMPQPAGFHMRAHPLPLPTWIAVLLPATVLVVLPALAERAACQRVQSRSRNV